jgi:DNA-binding transcriptional ArsR family regulator
VLNLAASFDMSLPAVSQHLRVLQVAHLVTRRREGRKIFYRLNPEPLHEIAKWIHPYERFWRRHLLALGEHLRRKHGAHHR